MVGLKATLPEAELEFRALRSDSSGLLVLVQGRSPLPTCLIRNTVLEQRIPSGQVRPRQILRRARAERRAVLEVRGHAAQDHRHPRGNSGLKDRVQIHLEVPVNPFLSRVARGKLPIQEHLQATPTARLFAGAKPSRKCHQSLTEPGPLQSQVGTHCPARRRLRAEDGAGAERAKEFVVSHVDDPHVPVVLGTFTRYRHNGMRVNRRHRHANHLEFRLRKPFAQENLQVAPNAVRRPRITQRRRLAEEENAKSAWRLLGLHHHRACAANQCRWKETKAKVGVLHQDLLAPDLFCDKERSAMSETGHSERHLRSSEKQQWHPRRNHQAEKPKAQSAPGAKRRVQMPLRIWDSRSGILPDSRRSASLWLALFQYGDRSGKCATRQ